MWSVDESPTLFYREGHSPSTDLQDHDLPSTTQKRWHCTSLLSVKLWSEGVQKLTHVLNQRRLFDCKCPLNSADVARVTRVYGMSNVQPCWSL